jgi:hypothetical protein
LGALYDVRPLYLVLVSVAVQLLAVPFYLLSLKADKAD